MRVCGSPAVKRYNRRVLGWSALYAGALCGAEALLLHVGPADPLRYLIALAPGLAVLGIFYALGRYLIEEGDEYQRARTVKQILIATAATLGICTIWGFLETLANVPHAPFYAVAIIWFGCFGLASCVLWVGER